MLVNICPSFVFKGFWRRGLGHPGRRQAAGLRSAEHQLSCRSSWDLPRKCEKHKLDECIFFFYGCKETTTAKEYNTMSHVGLRLLFKWPAGWSAGPQHQFTARARKDADTWHQRFSFCFFFLLFFLLFDSNVWCICTIWTNDPRDPGRKNVTRPSDRQKLLKDMWPR